MFLSVSILKINCWSGNREMFKDTKETPAHLPIHFPIISSSSELVPLLEVAGEISSKDSLLQHGHYLLVVLGRETCNERAVFSIYSLAKK